MSKINEEPCCGPNNEILYSINVYEENGELFIELDEEGNIKTNIVRLITKIINYENDGKIIEVEHDLYSRLNSGINPLTGEIKEEVIKIIEKLYGKDEEEVA